MHCGKPLQFFIFLYHFTMSRTKRPTVGSEKCVLRRIPVVRREIRLGFIATHLRRAKPDLGSANLHQIRAKLIESPENCPKIPSKRENLSGRTLFKTIGNQLKPQRHQAKWKARLEIYQLLLAGAPMAPGT